MAGSPGWHLPLIAVGVGFHLAVSWAVLWRYFQARERSLLTWGLAWLVMTAHVLGIFLTHMGFARPAPLLRDLSFAAAALAFLSGQVERSGRSPASLQRLAALGTALLLPAIGAGLVTGDPIRMTAAAVAGLSLVGAAWLSFPSSKEGKASFPAWLLFAGYAVGGLHAILYALPVASVVLEMAGQALFSLFFSAAVTWQSWEHEKAVRLFSRTLERLNRPLTTQEALDGAASPENCTTRPARR